MEENLYKLKSDEWLSMDKDNGVGRGSVSFKVPLWKGREDRIAVKVIHSGNTMKGVKIKQIGMPIDDVSVNMLEFPIRGGDRQIMVTTNSASLKVNISSDKSVKSIIKSFTTASGLNIDVNDTRLDYGFPGDPGLNGAFQVSLIVSLPDNTGNEEIKEIISINGVSVKIYQEGRVVPFIRLAKDFDQVESSATLYTMDIESNIEDYDIEIVDCQESKETKIVSDKDNVVLDRFGNPQVVKISTYPRDLNWRVEK